MRSDRIRKLSKELLLDILTAIDDVLSRPLPPSIMGHQSPSGQLSSPTSENYFAGHFNSASLFSSASSSMQNVQNLLNEQMSRFQMN